MRSWMLLGLVLLQACGNPHLTRPVAPTDSSILPIMPAGELQALRVGAPDNSQKLQVVTNGTSSSSTANVMNPNPDTILVVTYSFESGENFRFRGGSMPGTSGDCASEHLPTKTCQLDIEFFAQAPGVYADNLIATYYPKNDPSDLRRVLMPLRAEKQADAPLIADEVTAKSRGGNSAIDFGRDLVGTARQDAVVVKNEGERDMQVSVRLQNGQPFAIANNCAPVLRAGESCEVLVNYLSSSPGIHQDEVVITSWSTTPDTARQQRIPVVGEAYNEANPCGNVPCAEEPKPGLLRLAALHGDGIDFGSTSIGGEVVKQIEITNVGDLPVVLSNKTLNGSVFVFSGGSYPGTNGTCGETILPGSCIITLIFKPTGRGAQSSVLTLVPTTGASLLIGLSGIGEARPAVCEATEDIVISPRPSANAAGITFPYLSSARGTSASLSYLYGTRTNHYVRAIDRHTVKDAQVFVVYDIPQLEGDIIEARLAVDVLKVVADGHRDTESLCLSSGDIRRCSGQEFTLASWQRLKNPAFWVSPTTPVNGLYENEFARGESRCGAFTCMSLQTEYDVRALFGLGRRELHQLKGASTAFIFSDDTRLVSMPRLVIKSRKRVSCR